MRLDWINGMPLFCRRCQAEVAHSRYRYPGLLLEALVDDDGHVQSPHNAMLSLSVEEEVDPAVILLPLRNWSARYVEQRQRLLMKWKSLNHGA